MPPVYRYEVAKQGRAGCQNTACKKDNVKIAKGELRFGSLVQIPNFGDSWKWKHWGCVTPQQIENIVDQLGGLDGLDLDKDLDALDGYDELPDWAQTKVRDALMNGHVDDEDWKGDPELNRVGQKGINKRSPKKKKKDDEESGDDATADSPVKAKKGGRKKRQVPADDDEEEPAPKKKAASKKRKSVDDAEGIAQPKKKAARSKKAADEDQELKKEDLVPEPVKKQGSRTKKVATKEEPTKDPASEPPKKKGRSKKAKQESDAEAEGSPAAGPSIPQEDGTSDPKTAKTIKKVASKYATKRTAPDDEGNDEQEPKDTTSKSARGSRSKKAKLESTAEDVIGNETVAKLAEAGKGKKSKNAPKEGDEIVDARDKKKQTGRLRGKKRTSATSVPEDEQTTATQPVERELAVTATNEDAAETGMVEIEASAKMDETPAKKNKKPSRPAPSARQRNSRGKKA